MTHTLYQQQHKQAEWHRLAVAPMMGWTDRHCRFFHHCLAPSAVLYSEMVTADAIRFGNHHRLLHQTSAGTTILQLGGCDPRALAEAVSLAETYEYNYAGYNLNAGCPSPRVQNGGFGACLMETPNLAAELVAAMKTANPHKPISVKCRIGVDDMDTMTGLDRFAEAVIGAGADYLIVHARRAILGGLNPKQNRTIPPLDYGRVYALKQRLGGYPVVINGGLAGVADVREALANVDGVMLGRVAYQRPRVLWQVASAVSGHASPELSQVIETMAEYVRDEIKNGTPLIAITRHMLGLGAGLCGGRRWRRMLSEEARTNPDDTTLIMRAWDGLAKQAIPETKQPAQPIERAA